MLRIVSLAGSQVLIIGLFSHTDTHSYTVHLHTHTHTHAHIMQSIQKFHKSPNFCNHLKKGINHFFSVCSLSLCLFLSFSFFLLLYNMSPVHGTSLLMTMSSCLSPRSNLELRWRQSALVFLDEPGSTDCQRATP